MTLILSLGNKDHIVQISDRRLSNNGKLIDDESNKCGVMFCLNARMSFGYTGLARWGKFETFQWLLKALHDSAEPDYTIGEILNRLKNNATDTFNNAPIISSVPREHKRLAIMFSGFINLDETIKPGNAILSNFHNFNSNTAFDIANNEFELFLTSATKDVENPTLVQRVGNWAGMSESDISLLRNLLIERRPCEAVEGKAVEIFRRIAEDPKSKDIVGKQLMSVIIPSNINIGVEANYFSEKVKRETFFPALVYLLPNQHLTVENIFIEPVEPDTPPLSVPKVGRNVPCPCGSKIKYKLCHGKKSRNPISFGPSKD